MSVCGVEEQNRAFRPLIPGVKFIEFLTSKDGQGILKNNGHPVILPLETEGNYISIPYHLKHY